VMFCGNQAHTNLNKSRFNDKGWLEQKLQPPFVLYEI